MSINNKQGKFNLELNQITIKETANLLRNMFKSGGHPMPVCICSKPGCIAGDVRIRGHWKGAKQLNSSMPIEHIYKHQHGIGYLGSYQHASKTFVVKCYNEQTKTIEDTTVTSTYSGKKQCYRIETNTKYSVEVTEEHPIYTQRGWVECKDLIPGDTVYIYPNKLTGDVGRIKAKKMPGVCVKYHPTGSKKVVNGCVYFRKDKHILEYEAFRNNMTFEEYRKVLNNYKGQPLYFVPKGLEVHHKDRNRENNNPDNILLLTTAEHARLHHKEDGKFGHMGSYKIMPVTVTKIVKTTIKDTYDLSCEKNFNFFAGNILVHNCGKSQIIQQVCREFDITHENGRYHEIRASEVVDSSDLTGLPVITKKLVNLSNGIQETDPATEYSRSKMLPIEHVGMSEEERNKLHVVFFDEINRSADPAIMNAIFQLTTEWRVGQHKLLPNVIILLALNPEAEGYLVNSMDPALINRICFLFVKPEFKDWKEYAENKGLEQSVIDFLDTNRSFFSHDGILKMDGQDKRFPTPRAWENVSRVINTFGLDFSNIKDAVSDISFKVIAGVVGETAALEYITYVKTNYDSRPITGETVVKEYLKNKTLQNRVKAKDSKGLRKYDTTMVQATISGVEDYISKNKDKVTDAQLANTLAFLCDIPVEQSMSFQNMLTLDIGSDFTNWFFTKVNADKNLAKLWKCLQEETKKYAQGRKASTI